MTDPDASDSNIFGRIDAEHQELRDLLARIHRTLANDQSSVEEVTKLLRTLCDDLRAHFRNEEEQGFFSQITDHAPRLTSHADSLCGEHLEMLLDAEALAKQSEMGDGTDRWRQALSEAFHSLSKQLMHHESEENQLLQQAYSEDIGGQD